MKNIIKNTSLYTLLNQEYIIVPDYQRDYAQGRTDDKIDETRRNFVTDIIAASIGQQETHIGLVYGSNNIGLDGFVAVDGQQRLTTAFLFHLYLAKVTKNEDADKLILVLKNFGWSARVYASEFMEFLMNVSWDIKRCEPLSNQLKESIDYFTLWEKDPTVVNILVMLDEIHNQMSMCNYDQSLMLKNLTGEACKLIFDYKKLVDGTDEFQYQKMNSRGRELTTYELFKQKLQSVASLGDNFKQKMDNEWLSFFDDLTPPETDPDVYYQNYINEIALFLGIKDQGETYSFVTSITNSKPSATRTDVGFVRFAAYEAFIRNLENVELYLDWLTRNYVAILDLTDGLRYNGEDNSFYAIFDNPTWYIRSMNYAVWQYAVKSEFKDLKTSAFKLWWRPIHNLIFNTPIDSTNFSKYIDAIDKFPITNVDDYVINSDISFFSTYQVSEEKEKYKLLKHNEALLLMFEEQEKRRRFQGQIGILLPDEDNISLDYWDKIVSAFDALTNGIYDSKQSDFNFITAMFAFVNPNEEWSIMDRLPLKYEHGNVRGQRVPARWIHRMLFFYLSCLSRNPNLLTCDFFRYCRIVWRLRYASLSYEQQKRLVWISNIYNEYYKCNRAYENSRTKRLRYKDGNIWLYYQTNKNSNDILLSNRRSEVLKFLFPEEKKYISDHDIVVYDETRNNLKVVFASTNIWIGYNRDNPIIIPEILPDGIWKTDWHKAWSWFDWGVSNNFYEHEGETFEQYLRLLKTKFEEWCDDFVEKLK